MSESNETDLKSLAGAAVPASLIEELRSLAAIEPPGSADFWMMMSVLIQRDPPRKQLAEQLVAVAEQVGLPPVHLERAVQAHRFLLREAARRGLSLEDYAGDLARVAPNAEVAERLQRLLLPGYASMTRQLREEMVVGAVADHGKTLVDVDWRVDAMLASSRGKTQEKRLGVMTFQYFEGARQERITFNVQPDLLLKLHQAVQQMLEV